MDAYLKLIGAPPRSKSVAQLPVAWVLVLLFIFFAVRGRFSFEVGAGYDLTALTADSSSPIGAIGGALAYLMVAVLIMLNLKRVFKFALRMKWLTLLALLTIVSTIWSQNPFRSFSYGICYLLSTLFGYYLVLRFDFEQLIKLLALAGIMICVVSAAFVVGLPQYGISYDDPRNPGAWVGIFSTRTGAAQVLTFFMGPGLVVGTNGSNWRQFAYVLTIAFFIVMSRPVTGLILMFFYVVCMAVLYLSRRVERRTALTLGLNLGLFCSFGVHHRNSADCFSSRVPWSRHHTYGENRDLAGPDGICGEAPSSWVWICRVLARAERRVCKRDSFIPLDLCIRAQRIPGDIASSGRRRPCRFLGDDCEGFQGRVVLPHT